MSINGGVGGTVAMNAVPNSDPIDVAVVTVVTGVAQKLVATTPGVLAAAGVNVQAASTNTGSVYVGSVSASPTRYSYELQAGQSVTIPVQDPSRVYVAAAVVGLKVAVGWV